MGKYQGVNLLDEQVGDLLVVERIQRPVGKAASGRWWRCRCKCGAEVLRNTGVLLKWQRIGRNSACHACVVAAKAAEPRTAAPADEAGNFIIYCITHAASQKRYVGLTKRPLASRWVEHQSRARNPRPTFRLHLAVRKHGAGAFTVEQLEDGLAMLSEAKAAEQWWVQHFGSVDPVLGYNGTAGGDGPGSISAETREKLRAACKRQKASQTPAERRAIHKKGDAQRRATMATKTPEERAAAHAAKGQALRLAWAAKTPEERAERGRRISAGRSRSV